MSHSNVDAENNPETKKLSNSELPGQLEMHVETNRIKVSLKKIHNAKMILARQLHEAGFSLEAIGRILHLKKKDERRS